MAGYQEQNDETDIYSDDSRAELVEDGEMSPEEEGFMEGFNEESKKITCAECKQIIIDSNDAIQAEIDNEELLFCSEECYSKYKKRHDEG